MWHTHSFTIQSVLEPHEVVYWFGQPRQGVIFRASDLFYVPFSLVWGGLAFSWTLNALRNGMWGFAMLNIPFILFGIYLIIGRFITDAVLRKHIYYGITNTRVIIVSGVRTHTLTSVNLHMVRDIAFHQHTDGRGTITFGAPTFATHWYREMPWLGVSQNQTPCLEHIPNGREVYRIIRQIEQQHRSDMADQR
jgi:hypothetical protein